MADPDVEVGATYVHPSGLRLRVLDQHVPGDRDDELRVWCEVVTSAPTGDVTYPVGYRDGWVLSMHGWQKETA